MRRIPKRDTVHRSVFSIDRSVRMFSEGRRGKKWAFNMAASRTGSHLFCPQKYTSYHPLGAIQGCNGEHLGPPAKSPCPGLGPPGTLTPAPSAKEFDIAHSVVSRLWKSFKTTGMCSRRHGGGRVRSTTPAEDRYIVLSAKRNRRTTAQQVANQFLAASGKQISRKTVARRLRGGGLYARRPVVCVPLTRQHRTARL
ncbi:hypothetical protein TNCV_1545601 [Trichonephila clavipes]|nr:hypothetical protein TNCV_1545601 [Trichonephila clavipes]